MFQRYLLPSFCIRIKTILLFLFLLYLAVLLLKRHADANDLPSAGTIGPSNQSDHAKVLITEEDITYRPYDVLGTLEVMIDKSDRNWKKTALGKLKKFAVCLGADAVIRVEFISDGDFTTHGYILARGTAIKFK